MVRSWGESKMAEIDVRWHCTSIWLQRWRAQHIVPVFIEFNGLSRNLLGETFGFSPGTDMFRALVRTVYRTVTVRKIYIWLVIKYYLLFSDNLLELNVFFNDMNYERIEESLSYGVSIFFLMVDEEMVWNRRKSSYECLNVLLKQASILRENQGEC